MTFLSVFANEGIPHIFENLAKYLSVQDLASLKFTCESLRNISKNVKWNELILTEFLSPLTKHELRYIEEFAIMSICCEKKKRDVEKLLEIFFESNWKNIHLHPHFLDLSWNYFEEYSRPSPEWSLFIPPTANYIQHDFINLFHDSICEGETRYVRFLLHKFPYNDFATIACFAATNNFCKITKVLLRKGKINPPDSLGRTPLHIASVHGYCDIVKLILEKTDKSAIKNKRKEIPLHLAAGKGRLKIVKMLVKHDPKAVLIKDGDGQLPHEKAEINGHIEVSEFLSSIIKEDEDS